MRGDTQKASGYPPQPGRYTETFRIINSCTASVIEEDILYEVTWCNSPDNFLNGFTRLSGLTVPGSRYFFKVSSTPDLDNKILSTVESGFEAQNLLKFCPEYCW